MKTLVLVDSSKIVPYRRSERIVFNFLEHFGIWYETIDLNWTGLSYKEAKDVHLIILCQEGINSSISESDFSVILKCVENGAGLVIFDGYLNGCSEKFLKSIGIENFGSGKTGILKLKKHWITELSSSDMIFLKNPTIHFYTNSFSNYWEIFMKNEDNYGCGICRRYGKGKIVLFTTFLSIFLEEYLGHTEGLDGVFFRSLIWAAKKPFITKTMPFFITARIDDVSGSANKEGKSFQTVEKLRYIDILNKYKFIPNVGLLIDEIESQDELKIKEKFFEGLAEFSPHAFSLSKKEGDHLIYFDTVGREFPEDKLKENFEKVDKKLTRMGIKMSKTLNAHLSQVGINSFPFLRERGVKYLMNLIKVGKKFDDPEAIKWDIKPYNNSFFSLGYIPENEYFFNVTSIPPWIEKKTSKKNSLMYDCDFLYGCTPYRGENSKVDIEKSIKRGVYQIKRGLENGFFGCLFTTERRIAQIPLADFEKIIAGISKEIKNIPAIFKSYDSISVYAENRANYRIEDIKEENGITIYLKGQNNTEQLFYLFTEKDDTPQMGYLKIPAFQKQIILNFPI